MGEATESPARAIVDRFRLITDLDRLNAVYDVVESDDDLAREFGKWDRYYLFTRILARKDGWNPWLLARCREVENAPDGHLDLWSRGHYKAVCLDELVPTPQGWRKHGDLAIGDQVFGRDGKPTNVIAKTPVFHDADCWRVSFDCGYSVVVSGDHLWTVNVSSKKRIAGTNTRIGSVETTINTRALSAQVEASRSAVGRILPRVRMQEATQYPERELPIHPYALGVWLGDGTATNNNITCDIKDADEMQANLLATGHAVTRRQHSNAVTLVIDCGIRGKRGTSPFRSSLRDMHLMGYKRIPHVYMLASVEQRMELLRGLMDTDGSCHKDHAQAIFCNANHELAEDVLALVCSLGIKASIAERSGVYKGVRRAYWQVQFKAFADNAPFKLARKVARCSKTKTQQTRYRMVTSVEPVATVPVSCIQVDAADGLYLVGKHHVTTHNSSLITYAGIIQEILRDPDITVGLFSHTRPIAKAFLKQIKREFEANETLKRIYPDICYAQPHKESPQWSEDGGIVVKRQSNPKEATVEAWGLIDGQPTSKHYALRVYDDVVTRESVTTPEQVRKTTEALDLSQNLGPMNKVGREWYIGTRYSYADTYQTMIERKQVILRVYPATDDGTKTGKPVFMAQDAWESLLKKSSDYSIACQQLQNPTAGTAAMFDKAWLRVTEVRPETLNVYIMVDPASSKKATSDRTAMAVIGIDCNENKFLIDGACHRMNLAERWDMLKSLRRRWFNMPGVQSVHVGYEKYGMQSDLEFFEQEQMRDGRSFDIKELGWTRDGTGSKSDRVQRLIPDFKCERFYLPARHDKPTSVQQRMIDAGRKHLVMNDIRKKDEEGRVYSVVERFIEEYAFFPFSSHDDMIDAVSRIYDMEYNIPMIVREESLEPEYV